MSGERTQLTGRWLAPAVWITLPFTAGPALADALESHSRPVQIVASVLLWVGWAKGLVAVAVPRTLTLTILRIVAPASFAVAIWAAITSPTLGVTTVTALATTLAATIAALWSVTGDVWVNGSSYGDEQRFALRTPGALLFGPLELAWAVSIGGGIAGPLLLAAGMWVVGTLALVVGWPACWFAVRALHGLSRRWVVFVPAGFVLHDLAAMADALLLPRKLVAHLGPAPADTTAHDLTAGALGLALQVDLTEPTEIAPRPKERAGGAGLETVEVQAILFTPARPGALLSTAGTRRIVVD